ncbi:type I restriction endonuclease [Micromonospora sp. DT4]|uniref:type I restriction endonuclease n=1 Tax=Micromonospora sp. DT4 TaxID=3393438 RepID=UPI003CF2E71F
MPPSPPSRQVPQSIADGLQSEIQRYKDELAQTKLLLEGKASLAQAQADAMVAADRAVRDADARRDQAAALVASLAPSAQAEQAALDSKGTPKVSAARREEFIARARRASHEPLNEMQTRVEIDEQLGAAGWTVQDESQINLYAGTGVAVREVTLATGRADYLLYVNQRLVGVIEAKREGTAPRGVEAQLDRYLNGLTAEQKLAAWHRDDPLPFGYVATGTETAFVNRLDPFPRTREVFAFYRPETFAGQRDQPRLHLTSHLRLDRRGEPLPAGDGVLDITTTLGVGPGSLDHRVHMHPSPLRDDFLARHRPHPIGIVLITTISTHHNHRQLAATRY